ncbi:MAG TPA: transporter [Thermoanaerobaculia bacterium]|nr:transporter [Thermoanaerobaculia bacterium]
MLRSKRSRSLALPLAGMFLVLLSERLLAQAPAQPAPAATPQIQDNSFLVEEAYNQTPGVVQTIQTFSRMSGSGDWVYTLTQEWPVPRETHQLSVTIPVQGVTADTGRTQGLGDVALNYRYQLVGNGDAKVAVSPRLTLVLPSGDRKRSLGSGGLGIQVSLPVSLVLSNRLVTHWNAGATFTPSATDASGETASLTSWNAGQSVVWLAHPRFNLFLETVVNSVQAFADGGGTERHLDVTVSPGARFAFNLPNDLQIVLGLAVPMGFGANHGQNSLFLYFSVELPFWHPAR